MTKHDNCQVIIRWYKPRGKHPVPELACKQHGSRIKRLDIIETKKLIELGVEQVVLSRQTRQVVMNPKKPIQEKEALQKNIDIQNRILQQTDDEIMRSIKKISKSSLIYKTRHRFLESVRDHWNNYKTITIKQRTALNQILYNYYGKTEIK